jgi:16S rRNA (guanine1207-N2)-methyltransferase
VIELHLPDLSFRLATDTGVFAGSAVDVGTKIMLAESPPPRPGSRTLVDLGCGYGPIALTLASRAPESTVWAVDVNRRARELCAENAATAGLRNVVVVAPDEVPPDIVVDEIWSNPPIRIGKQALHHLLEIWLDRLAADGIARLVVQKHLGADSLATWLNAAGWPTTRVLSRRAYRILEVAARGLTRIN